MILAMAVVKASVSRWHRSSNQNKVRAWAVLIREKGFLQANRAKSWGQPLEQVGNILNEWQESHMPGLRVTYLMDSKRVTCLGLSKPDAQHVLR